jgi:hypothetical protein
MSQVDDILFAPISKPEIDFQIRKNQTTFHYDWKPISNRAHVWCLKHYARWYMGDQEWIINFTSASSKGKIRGLEDFLFEEFVFEEVSS